MRARDLKTDAVTEFTGYDVDECAATVLEVSRQGDSLFIITDKTPFYAEMGGQVSDAGLIESGGESYHVMAVQQIGNARAHVVEARPGLEVRPGDRVHLSICLLYTSFPARAEALPSWKAGH